VEQRPNVKTFGRFASHRYYDKPPGEALRGKIDIYLLLRIRDSAFQRFSFSASKS
jgi:hypothetical protein